MQAIKNPVHDRRNNEQTESLAYELSTLGGLLQDNRAWPEISAIVQTDDFADDRN